MRHQLLLAIALAACAAESPSPSTTSTIEQRLDPCDDDQCPQDDLPSCEYCDETSTCHFECRDERTGDHTTCADAGYCQSCDVCGPDVSCSEQCMEDDGRVTTCATQKAQCQKWDVYCAFPAIFEAGITNSHEGRLNGPESFMYFRGAGGVKTGNYPTMLGGRTFDPNSAWASNFRGPAHVSGTRPQWEWTGPSTNFHRYPFIYGSGGRCRAVPANAPIPVLPDHTELVYEDDECWGFVCNPDDYVGKFTMQRSRCTADVFDRGQMSGWSPIHYATGASGSIRHVRYELWCYSCLDSPTQNCGTGVVW
ncbi:MAG: hypothetical protein ACKV2T_13355 [Kofleriaceae bacterium]